MQIDANRLRTLLVHAGLKNIDLANSIGVSGKTVGRWIKGETTPPAATLQKIASELQVSVDVLTGESPLEEPKREVPVTRTRIGADVSIRTRNAFLLATARYGVTQTDIIELAPLMFTLIAEQSLDFRRRILREAGEHVDALEESPSLFAKRLVSYRVDEGIFEEEEASIEERDIFGLLDGRDIDDLLIYTPTDNPFFKYLQHLANELTEKYAVRLEEDEDTRVENVPSFSMFHEEAMTLAGGDAELADRIAHGILDLGKMPTRLRKADTTETQEERLKWLKDESQRVREKSQKFFAKFLKIDLAGGENDRA